VRELVDFNLECDIDQAAGNSAISENEIASLLDLEEIHDTSELVLLAGSLGRVHDGRFIVIGAILLRPGDAVSLALDPFIGERIHVAATVLHALALESEMVVACFVVRAPDNGPLVAVKEARHALELAVPPPQVIVIAVDGVLRSGQHAATGKNAGIGHQLKSARHDVVDVDCQDSAGKQEKHAEAVHRNAE